MRAGIKPETVVAAAADIADRDGWEQVSLANVAGHLGIKTPSLYNHVDGLTDLRRKLAVHAVARLSERLRDAAIGHSGKTALIEIGRSYVAFARRHPGLYDAINRLAEPRPEQFERESRAILALFERLLLPLGVAEEDFVHAVRGLRSMVHGFASLESAGGFQLKADVAESLSKAVTYYIDGLSAIGK